MPKDDPTKSIRAIEERLLGIAQSLKQAFAAAEDAVKQGGGAHDATSKTSRGPIVAQTTVRMRVGGFAAQLGAAANRSEPLHEPKPQAREPLIDSYEEADALVVTAELPGVLEGDITVAVEDGELVIESAGARRYRAALPLPPGLDPARLERRLTNGILEIRIPKGAPDVG